ncbi:MAG: hypothetical protein ISR58_13550 [Anaerolineales bacterium]|nr:hypothetical protein [Chloroflexota bacterium]MBL6982203.1 hypothetical protein [Anaerolineales bacterium]
MPVKLLMSWNILPGREQEYFEFVVREFIPDIQQLGLETTEAWVTVYGDHPQILAAARTNNPDDLRQIILSQEWDALTTRLLDFVKDLEFRTVRDRPGFQM